MAADTSSAPAASTSMVGAAAIALAALTADPMTVKSVAAAATSSGVATTNDIAHLPGHPDVQQRVSLPGCYIGDFAGSSSRISPVLPSTSIRAPGGSDRVAP